MKNDELKKLLREIIGEVIEKTEGHAPKSKPGAYSTKFKTINEPAYQRSIISSGSHSLNNLGQVMWLDIELPVVFGVSSRRSCVDLVGKYEDNRFVLCELKYEKPEKNYMPTWKPRTGSPVYALRELLSYYYHTIENADRLQKDGIWHTNSKGQLDWTLCKDTDNAILVVAANDTYWDRWRNYNPKSGKNGWLAIAEEIKDIISRFKGELIIKFYSTPRQQYDFTTQAQLETQSGVNKGYTPYPLKGDWTEVEI